MTMTRDQMVQKVLRATGLDETDTDAQADALLLLNQSLWDILDDNPFREKEKTATFQTEDGEINYQMPDPFEALQSLSIIDPVTLQHSNLAPMTREEYQNTYNANDSNKAKPSRYIREACFATLYPTPDDVYDMVLKYWVTIDDLSDSNESTTLPQSWDEIIMYGAIARGFFDLGDRVAGADYIALQDKLLYRKKPTEIKEQQDTRASRVQPFNYRGGYNVGASGRRRR